MSYNTKPKLLIASATNITIYPRLFSTIEKQSSCVNDLEYLESFGGGEKYMNGRIVRKLSEGENREAQKETWLYISMLFHNQYFCTAGLPL